MALGVKNTRGMFVMRVFLIVMLILVLLGCGGSGNSRDAKAVPKFLSSPELLAGEALVYIGNGAKQCQSNGMSADESAQIQLTKVWM